MCNKLSVSLACAAAACVAALAEPLNLDQVPGNAKWLLHLDLDAFRKTAIGAHCLEKIIQPKIEQAKPFKDANLSLHPRNISSITAYGAAFENNGRGVLMIRSTADVKKDLDTLCGLSSLSGGEMLKLDQLNPYPIYSFKNDVFIAPNIRKTVLVAKSRNELEKARQVLLGEGKTLADSRAFSDYPAKKPDAFFYVLAEGFNDSASIPPQAQVLRETRGGRFVVREEADKLEASLAFKGKDEESALKIQQVFQGIMALVSLSQENPELKELLQGASISAHGHSVMLNVQIPVNKAIHRIHERTGH